MKTVEIRIPELGKAVGTTSYVAEKIAHIQNTLKVGKTKQDEPCLTYEHWENEKDGKPAIYVLMFISNEMYQENYENLLGNVYSVFPEADEQQYRTYLFPVLSEKAREYVERYLIDLARKFHSEYNEL